jgi:large subunit ribosomal protein L21
MYAIFEDGARQYRASVGEVLKVDYRGGEDGEGLAAGTPIEFSRVLLYCNGNDARIGQPTVDGARVVCEVVDHPSTKVVIQKFRRRKNYRRLRGHRQWQTAVRVKNILLAGEQPAAEPSAASS